MKKRIAALILGAVITLTPFTTAFGVGTNIDHWSQAAFSRWVEKGIIKGNENGDLLPDNSMTRAEYITVLNRFLGLKEVSGLEIEDVKATDWFAEDIKKAIKAGYLKVDTSTGKRLVNPTAELSRKDAALYLYRALNLSGSEYSSVNFNDIGSLNNEETTAIAILKSLGAINGYPDGSFKPNNVVTRGELVSLLDKGVAEYYNASGTFSPSKDGLVIVNSSKVTIKKPKALKDIILTANASRGFKLTDTTVNGVLVINSTPSDVVSFTGENSVNKVIVYGDVELNLSADTTIQELEVANDNARVVLKGEGTIKNKRTTGTNASISDKLSKPDSVSSATK